MTVRHRNSFCMLGLVTGASVILGCAAWAGPNSISVSPSVSGGAFARPDITNRSLNVGRNIAPLGVRDSTADTGKKKKNTAKTNETESFESKVLRTKQKLQMKKQDAVLRSGRKGRPATEGSPQPDPPKIVQPAVTTSPAASVGVGGPSIVLPPGLESRFQDKADAQAIDDIKALEAAIVGLPQRQGGRPGEKSPLGDDGLPGTVPEPNATVPGAPERPSAEDILAGRPFGGRPDNKHDIARGYPGAAGGAVPDRRGQAADGYTTVVGTVTRPGAREGEKETVQVQIQSNGDQVVITQTSRSDGTTVTQQETYAPSGNGWRSTPSSVAIGIDRPNGTFTYRVQNFNRRGEVTYTAYGNRSGTIREVDGPGQPDQPVPTDDYRTVGKDNCGWVPLIGCTARSVSPQDMTAQPGRGERSERPVANLPDSDQVTNPAEGREGSVGFRAPVNPGGPSSPDPERNPDAPTPR